MQGASVHAKTLLGWTPLHFAALQSNVELVDTLLDEGADVLASGKDGCVPGDCATHPDVRRSLFRTGAHSAVVVHCGHALHTASASE